MMMLLYVENLPIYLFLYQVLADYFFGQATVWKKEEKKEVRCEYLLHVQHTIHHWGFNSLPPNSCLFSKVKKL